MANRNVVLITADSVRVDYCGWIDSSVTTTKTLNVMSNKGVEFRNAIAPGPRTPSSIPEIMTGRPLPNDHVNPADWQQRIARIGEHMENSQTLAERLRAQGYNTIAFTSNPWTGTYSNFDKGFDEFRKTGKRQMHDLNLLADTKFEAVTRTLDEFFNGMIWRPLNGIGAFARWPQYFDDLVSAVADVSQPFFLWVFLLDTHSPYLVPRVDRQESNLWHELITQFRANSIFKETGTGETSAYRRTLSPSTIERLKRMYRDSIRSVDRFVQSLWDEIESTDPVLIFHSDHGEAFGEHGTIGHHRVLYEENVHVPLVVYNSGSTGRVEEVVSLRSMSDMIDALLTEKVPVTDPRWQVEQALLRTEDNRSFGLRTSRWKYIKRQDTEELYDLNEDPFESDNAAVKHPDRLSNLRQSLEDHIDALPTDRSYEVGEIDAETETRLSDLGYID